MFFSDLVHCGEWIVSHRWPNGVECLRQQEPLVLAKVQTEAVRHATRQFTVKTGTIFDDSPLGLDKWLAAMWQVGRKERNQLVRGTRHALALETIDKLLENRGR